MEKNILKAKLRKPGRHQTRETRKAGAIPGVLYGANIKPEPLSIDAQKLNEALVDAGGGLIPLVIGRRKPLQVLAREIQRDPIKRNILHIDFQAVSMTEKLRLSVPITHVGTAEILNDPSIVLVRNVDTVEIACLPTDIPNSLVADLSKLQTLDDSIYAKDLTLPLGVELVTNPEHMVLGLTVARAAAAEEEEEEEGLEEVAAEEVEVVAKGKTKEEEQEA